MFHLILKENNSYDKEIALNGSLNDRLDIFSSRSGKYSPHYRGVINAGEGLYNIGLCLVCLASKQAVFFSCHTCYDTSPHLVDSYDKLGTLSTYSNPKRKRKNAKCKHMHIILSLIRELLGHRKIFLMFSNVSRLLTTVTILL